MYAGKAHDSDRHTAGRDQGKGQVFHTFWSVAVFQPFADTGKQYQSQSITDSGADSVKQTLPECIVFLDIELKDSDKNGVWVAKMIKRYYLYH